MTNEMSDDQRAEFYKSHRDRLSTIYKKKHKIQFDAEFLSLTNADASMSVLEIGCGTGLFLRYLEDRNFKEIVGIDMDEGLSSALADLNQSEIYLDDVDRVLKNKLTGRRFDRIVLLDVAEHIHLDNLVSLVSDLTNYIKDDGKLLLRVPNIESPWGLKMFFGTFDHVTPLGPGRIRELAGLSGWNCSGVFPQEPQKLFRRLKERIVNRLLSGMLSYHPDIWTANILAVYDTNIEPHR